MTLSNVFKDIGLEMPAALLLKSQLMVAVLDHVKANGWGSADVEPGRAELLLQHDFNSFTLDEVVEMADRLGIKVQIL